MDPREGLRPHVEQIVRAYLGLEPGDELTVDTDGDIPVRTGSAMYYVSLLDRDPVLVRIWSIVLEEIDLTPDLLEELNDINASIVAARVFHTERRIVAASELRADTLDAAELAFACDSIGALAHWIDNPAQTRFGGETHFTSD